MRTLQIIFVLIASILFIQNIDAQKLQNHAEKRKLNSNFKKIVRCSDLIVSKLKVTKMTSTTIAYSYQIKNIGKGTASLEGATKVAHDNIKVQAFLSKDNKYSKDDLPAGGTIVASSPAGKLTSGQVKNGKFKSTVKKNPKNYKFLILLVDWGKTLKECNERNNEKAIPLHSRTSRCPDLVVDQLRVLDKGVDFVKYRYVVKNIGNKAVDVKRITVQAYLSTDRLYQSDDIPAGGRVLSVTSKILQPGQTIEQEFRSNTRENPLQYGALLMKVDKENKVRECRENNNLKATPLN